MATDDSNLVDDFNAADDDETPTREFYSDDVAAEDIAESNTDPEALEEQQDLPVTSGDMEIGDLDKDPMVGQGNEESYDEEATPAGDNVMDN